MALFVGSCGYLERALEQSGFYPKKRLAPTEKLLFYSARFNSVEIGSTFFTLPDPAAVFNWIVNTPTPFYFGVRCPALFCFYPLYWNNLPRWVQEELPHALRGALVKRSDLSQEVRQNYFASFISAIQPLHKRKKLGYILLQFPQWWEFSRENLTYLRRVREQTGPLPLAVEVRHYSWYSEKGRKELFATLKEENIAYVSTDSPLVPLQWRGRIDCTAEWGGVLRLHGQNARAWRGRFSMREKQNYLYSSEQLEEWRHVIQSVAEAARLHIQFNNCYADYATKNAAQMQELLQKAAVL